MIVAIDRDGYLAYLARHRQFVLEEAVQLGIEERGLAHDLSKYEAEELWPYADYFYGGHERGHVPAHVQAAFDRAWLRHQHVNDHHWQHWVLREDSGRVTALPMEDGARREMLADWRGAGRAILGDQADTKAWYLKNRAQMVLHPQTQAWIEEQLGL